MSLTPNLKRIWEPRNPAALSDVNPLLARLVSAFSAASIARLLDVDPAMATRSEGRTD